MFEKQIFHKNVYNHGYHAGSIRHKLSTDDAALTIVLTLLSVPSKFARLFSLCIMELTAFVTMLIIMSPDISSLSVESSSSNFYR